MRLESLLTSLHRPFTGGARFNTKKTVIKDECYKTVRDVARLVFKMIRTKIREFYEEIPGFFGCCSEINEILLALDETDYTSSNKTEREGGEREVNEFALEHFTYPADDAGFFGFSEKEVVPL